MASYSLLLQCPQAESEFVSAELYGLGTAGITERDVPGGVCELEAFFAERFDAAPLFGPFAPVWHEHEDAPWVDSFAPLAVGSRLYLVPDWRDDPAPEGRLRLTVHARQASGSGYQPATQLALEALERYLRPADRFLDVGTGSGILSAAAALLGSGARFACDLDLPALGEARENSTPALLFAGSARAVASGAVNMAAANLNAEVLLSLGGELPRVLGPGGRLILSGFRSRSLDRLASAFPFEVLDTLASGDWRALVLAV